MSANDVQAQTAPIIEGGGRDLSLQLMRGLAICAVVLIHTLPQDDAVVAIRPFLNFCVALFVFLSGYLTPRKKTEDIKGFYRKRVLKILVPYLVWTLVYLCLRRAFDPLQILKAVLTGSASAQLYYLVVYLCLVLLTPLLYRALDHRFWRACLYLVTPATLLAKCAFELLSLPTSVFTPFFGVWLIFYLVGLEWRSRWWPKLRGLSIPKCALLVVVLLAAQFLEGCVWNSAGFYTVAVSQLKISAMLCSLSVITLLMLLRERHLTGVRASNLLVKLGDNSFGIYLSHIVPIMVFNHFVVEKTVLCGVLEWAIVLLGTWLVVWGLSRLLPRRLRTWIGFV